MNGGFFGGYMAATWQTDHGKVKNAMCDVMLGVDLPGLPSFSVDLEEPTETNKPMVLFHGEDGSRKADLHESTSGWRCPNKTRIAMRVCRVCRFAESDKICARIITTTGWLLGVVEALKSS